MLFVDRWIIIHQVSFEFVVTYTGIFFCTKVRKWWYFIDFYFYAYKLLWFGLPLFCMCYRRRVVGDSVEESLGIYPIFMRIYDKLLINCYINSVFFEPLLPTPTCVFFCRTIQIVLYDMQLRVKRNLICTTCKFFPVHS